MSVLMDKRWVVDVVERLPQAALSRAWGWLARRKRPRLGVSLLKRVFVAAAGIDMAEANKPLREYVTLEDLFVRRLKSGARRIDLDPTALVSPADGRVGCCGRIHDGTLLQVKGRSYSVAALLADSDVARRFEGGDYLTIYLSPRDYHRVHAPVSGVVAAATILPGSLLPVFPDAVQSVDELFARNERLVTYLDSVDAGRLAVVKVGATLVGRITVTYDTEVHTNHRRAVRQDLTYDPPRSLAKGAELGAFELGSTVVLLAEPGRVRFLRFEPGSLVRMGQRLGTVLPRTAARRAAARRRGAAHGQGRKA
jgi:phosphatidylserine decarboxylase